eukprot:TRINITY_DN403_c0_g1_i1.p1 TRINITY_DN403_c0_g1~~TRINITY_DN403_c0_g1_i1.p1  ORF type:complete len:313 (+),score=66.65 TRINITY_DN403_c0_g1_i1:272-1210(+)
MKSLYIVGIIALLGLAFLLAEDKTYDGKFAAWKLKYGMSYNDEEDLYRQSVFADNLKMIENHKDRSYTVAINQFAGLTHEEFVANYLGLKVGQRNGKAQRYANVQVADIDWRTKGAVSAVKDQGQCGSCWSFSTTGNLEGVNFLFGSKVMTTYSEQQLVDCSGAYGNQGCEGGWMDYAFQYVEAKGITTEAKYPYVGVDESCKVDGGDFKVKTHTDVTKADCTGMLTALAIEPVSVAVDAENWSFYSSGIFSNCGDSLDHGVLLVGYNAEDNYYIVKNSWGASWGEQGYIRLAATNLADTCGICDAASYSSM